MDVHDVGLYRVNGVSRVLEPGMVLTVEPGLYICHDDEDVPKVFVEWGFESRTTCW